jgi:CheY-like chemotaxis protein
VSLPRLKSRGSLRILVVDDYLSLANAFVSIVRGSGYEARAANSAVEALSVAEEFKPHVLIADTILPEMDGVKLGAKLKERFPACRVLLMSACAREPVLAQEICPFKIVPKNVVVERAFQLLEACRRSKSI